MKSNGLPVVSSKHELDIIGIKIVKDFCPTAIKEPIRLTLNTYYRNTLVLTRTLSISPIMVFILA
jgi:hypothetical protein